MTCKVVVLSIYSFRNLVRLFVKKCLRCYMMYDLVRNKIVNKEFSVGKLI